jgi:aspartate aminotransferase
MNYQNILSRNILKMPESPTLSVNQKANELIKKGETIINLSIGDPDFDAFPHVKDAAIRAIKEIPQKYTSSYGDVELRKAVAICFERDNKLKYDPENQIVISPGPKKSIYDVITALLNPGDGIIIPRPYWEAYFIHALFCFAEPIFIDSDENLRLLPETLEETIKRNLNVKVVVLNYPCNPTGVSYKKSELEKFAEIIVKYNLILLSDEIYDTYSYEFEHTSIAGIDKEIYNRTITVNGASKRFAMTGWRIGWAGGPTEIMKFVANVQGNTSSCVNVTAQKAVEAAILGDQSFVKKLTETFKKRRDIIVEKINNIKGLKSIKPEGAFYIFPSIEEFIGLSSNGKFIMNDIDMSDYLLNEAKVATIPGSLIGKKNYIRFAYVRPKETLIQAFDQIKYALGKLK